MTVSVLLTWPVQAQPSGVTDEGPPAPSVGAEAVLLLSGGEVDQSASLSELPTSRFDAEAVALGPMPLGSSQVDKTFEGFGFDDNATENGVRFIPPDPIGAASHSRLIAVVNSMIESRNKGGHLKWRTGLASFFSSVGLLGPLPFDPKIIYDPHEDRFVVVALQLAIGALPQDPNNLSRILLAVSKDGNPQTPGPADWYFHAIDSKQTIFGSFDGWADYPGFEADEDAVYVTANIFTFVPFGFFGGARLWIVDKGVGSGGFYDGGPAGVTVHDPYAAAGLATTTMPCEVKAPGGVGPNIGTFLVSYSGLTDTVDEYVQVVRVDDPVGTPTFVHEFVNIGSIENVPPFPPLPDAPQLGTVVGIEVNDRRALDCAWHPNSIWLTTTILPEVGEVGQTTAHWFELDASGVPGGPILPADQGDITGEDIALDTFTFFPAVAINRNGEVKFGFSASAATIYAGAFATGRQAFDPPGQVQPSETIKAGEDFYIRTFGGTRNRWGDYSGIAVDPTNDDFFWVFNEFADQRGSPTGPGEDGRWGTAWGRCKFK